MASCSTPAAPPFASLAARRRFDAALDRREIVDGYLYGFGTPARSPVPPDVPGYVPVARDTTTSRGGAPLRFELLTVGSGEAPLEQMVQAQLRAVGMDVTIRQLELSAFLARVMDRRTISRPRWWACRVTRAWPILARWERSPACRSRRIRRRRSRPWLTRCRWSSSIMRGDCRG